jgi:hypothetical protein
MTYRAATGSPSSIAGLNVQSKTVLPATRESGEAVPRTTHTPSTVPFGLMNTSSTIVSSFAGAGIWEKLQQLAKFLLAAPGVADDSAHRERVHGIVPGNRDDSSAVRHHHVPALPGNPEPCLLKGAHRVKVVYSCNPRH